jgi:translation initiation factor 6 (eIF-6)
VIKFVAVVFSVIETRTKGSANLQQSSANLQQSLGLYIKGNRRNSSVPPNTDTTTLDRTQEAFVIHLKQTTLNSSSGAMVQNYAVENLLALLLTAAVRSGTSTSTSRATEEYLA